LLSFSHELRYGALAGVVKLLASTAFLLTGFVALSDDDYSRVVIAQGFAAAPSWDPSGTSWLPFPFWLKGSALRVLSNSFEVAQATSVFASAAALLPLYFAARFWGSTRWQATFGVALAGLLPYSVVLGAATPPDAFCAALIATAILTLGRSELAPLTLGGAALSIATLSRYESWPVALVFALVVLVRAIRLRSVALLGPAFLAIFGPVAWILHGALNHGDALFFVARVTQYQKALGLAPSSAWANGFRTPLALLRFEPEIMLLAFAVALLAAAKRTTPKTLAGGGWAACLALFLFLVWGDLRASTATHHAERTLLSLWMLAAILLVRGLGQLRVLLTRRDQAVLVCIAMLGITARFTWGGFSSFAPRSEERDIGVRAASLIPATDPVQVLTTDYGYFAILASLARPGLAKSADTHDPRTRAESPRGKRRVARFAHTGRTAGWWIVDRSLFNPERLSDCNQRVALENHQFLLVRLTDPVLCLR